MNRKETDEAVAPMTTEPARATLTKEQIQFIRRELVGAKGRWEELDATDARNLCLKLDRWLSGASEPVAGPQKPNIIHGLVTACEQVLAICEEGDTGADFSRVVNAMQSCSAALDNYRRGGGVASGELSAREPECCDRCTEVSTEAIELLSIAGNADLEEGGAAIFELRKLLPNLDKYIKLEIEDALATYRKAIPGGEK